MSDDFSMRAERWERMGADEHQDLLVLEISGRRLGLPAASVRELLRAVQITPVPRTSPWVEGIINLRGQIVPVLDFRRWLNLPAKPLDPSEHFVVVQAGERLVTFRVDRAVDLVSSKSGLRQQADLAGATDAFEGPEGLILVPDIRSLLEEAKTAPIMSPASSAQAQGQGGDR